MKDDEIARWQKAIYKAIKKHTEADTEIDGACCDSGDPLDVTLTEIEQGFEYLNQKICGDCNGDGWNYNAVEGRVECVCVSEMEPYQQQVEKIKKLRSALEFTLAIISKRFSCPETIKVIKEVLSSTKP